MRKINRCRCVAISIGLLASLSAQAWQDKQPNILVIWGDDIGITNLSAYSDGIMGYKTPNIDRIAKEGMRFTDYYGDQSCTAGRSSFITGQSPLRTGLSKVGLPGSPLGIKPRDKTLAAMLKDQGYVTAQFGKNHLGDKNEHLPTKHGFDEFFGNLYHLNAEQEPEHEDYPKEKWFKKAFAPRGVIKSSVEGAVIDTGALTKKRMETVDDEFIDAAQRFIKKSSDLSQPFFVWLNTTGMHYHTHTKASSLGRSGQGFYNDTMMDHDDLVGSMLDQLDKLGLAENTIVVYSTDNGVHFNMWPDSGITPFRSEKNSNWEGAYRVPAMVRWPGKIAAGTVSNEIMSHLDWLPTLMAAAGKSNVVNDLKTGMKVNGKLAKLHLDGFDFLPYLTGEVAQGPRDVFHYLDDQGTPVGIRMGDWKIVYKEQRAKTFALWTEPMVTLRIPKLFNLRRDPFERADQNSNSYWEWFGARAPYVYKGLALTSGYLKTFQAYPPSQKATSWSIDGLTEKFTNQRVEIK